MDAINHILDEISSVLWGYPMIILLVGTHLYLTIRLKFPQRKILTAIKLSVAKDKDGDGDVSQFGALATALAATIGTGNIIGVGTAIALGGPGAVFWCWITGVWHCHEVWRGTPCREIPPCVRTGAHAWRSDVCSGVRFEG